MDAALAPHLSPGDQDREIASTVRRERGRLLAFIRASIADAAEAEDVLQEALYELVLAYRLMQPVEQAGAWLRRVARNRIIDRFRRKGVERRAAGVPESEAAAPRTAVPQAAAEQASSEDPTLEDLLPAAEGGPESALMRELLLAEIGTALAELPREQREVFVAHEIEGVSFKELAARTGVSLNTLLSRKRYAVLHLQERLRAVWDEWLLS
jgi:RNA polymerase sigma factor (sigma-70 family)